MLLFDNDGLTSEPVYQCFLTYLWHLITKSVERPTHVEICNRLLLEPYIFSSFKLTDIQFYVQSQNTFISIPFSIRNYIKKKTVKSLGNY